MKAEHSKEVDEITETVMNEISELEAKVDQEKEKNGKLEA